MKVSRAATDRMLLLLGLLTCTFTCATSSNETDRPFGSCLDGKESCSECYLSLKKSLLSRDDNILNLSLAFYPPQSNMPEFVSITYLFGEASDSTSQEWFWTHDSSYLFFPLQTFQYHSLFFGKLVRDVYQTLTLTLDAECSTASSKNMELLTQRLRDFIERKKYNPQIDQNYFAKALLSKDDILDQSTANLIIIFYVVGTVFISIVAALMIAMCLYSKRWDNKLKRLEELSNSSRLDRSKIYGIASTSLLWNLYIFCLDITALWALHSEREETKLNALPSIILVFTLIGLLISAVLWCLHLSSLSCASKTMKKIKFIFLAFSILGPTLAIIIHLPYIAIAFLNDAYHASSVFIFYTIATFVLFAAFDFTIGTCQKGLIHSLPDTIDKLTSFNPRLRISIPTAGDHMNTHEVDATVFITGIEKSWFLSRAQEVQQCSLIRLNFRTSEGVVINQNSQITLHFDQNTDEGNIRIGCQVASSHDSTSVITVPELIVSKTNKVTVRNIQNENGDTIITFAPTMKIVSSRRINGLPSICTCLNHSLPDTIDRLTSFNPRLRISIPTAGDHMNTHEVDATLFITGIEKSWFLSRAQEVQQCSLIRLSFRTIEGVVINQNSQITLHFDQNTDEGNITIECQVASSQDATRVITVPELIVSKTNQVTVRNIQNENGYTIITFAPTMMIVSSRLINDSESIHCFPSLTKTKQGNKCIYSILIPAFVVLVLVLIVLIACVLILVPINDAFSDAPNRLVGFYQSVLILLGAFFLYKKYFKKKPSVERAIKKRKQNIPNDRVTTDEEWQQLSKDDRVAVFYSRIVDLVAKYPN